MTKTLEEILKESETGDVRTAIKALAERLNEDDKSVVSFMDMFKSISEGQKEICGYLKQLVTKEDKEIEFPVTQKVVMEKPDWYNEPEQDDKLWVTNLINSIRYDGDRTRTILKQILEKETTEEVEEKKEDITPIKTVNTGSLRTRRTAIFRIADNYNLKNIVSGGDGVTFYLPDSCIPNSERVSLNGGSPMKASDYTITGNKLVFMQGDQTNGQIEVRYSTR